MLIPFPSVLYDYGFNPRLRYLLTNKATLNFDTKIWPVVWLSDWKFLRLSNGETDNHDACTSTIKYLVVFCECVFIHVILSFFLHDLFLVFSYMIQETHGVSKNVVGVSH